MKNKFAERLKELRIEKGLTQSQLALNLNEQISQRAISDYEHNRRTPSIDAAIILARYFKVSVDYLVGNTDY